MPLLAFLADARDIVVIIYGILGILFFVVAVFATAGLYFTIKSLINKVTELLDESVKPTVNSIRDAADTVRGTTDFVGRTAVMPIARTYGAFAGVRKGLGVLSGLTKRRRGN